MSPWAGHTLPFSRVLSKHNNAIDCFWFLVDKLDAVILLMRGSKYIIQVNYFEKVPSAQYFLTKNDRFALKHCCFQLHSFNLHEYLFKLLDKIVKKRDRLKVINL